jgi:hypothetical protein
VLDWKLVSGLLAILLTVVGYIPYIRDVLSGKTKPHIYSWLLFALITLTAFALQLKGQAGIGCYATLTSTVLILTVVLLSFTKSRSNDVTMLDGVFVVFTLISLALWLLVKQPMWSAILITFTDLLAYGPTIRKSWRSPFSETPLFFVISAVRYIFIIVSLQTYSIITTLYPVAELTTLTFLACMLFWRRSKRVVVPVISTQSMLL